MDLVVYGFSVKGVGEQGRAIATFPAMALIAAAATRHPGKLLHHFQITTPQVSFHAHNEP